jgi:catechol 2,3-dioxygenase-like lactoylglutathione lyase family enzyme
MHDDRQASARFYERVFGMGFEHRSATFVVPDVDAVASAAWQHGGRVVDAPFDAGGGTRVATLADPQGAVFTVLCGRYAESVAAGAGGGAGAGAGARSRLSPLAAPIAAVSSAIDLRSAS